MKISTHWLSYLGLALSILTMGSIGLAQEKKTSSQDENIVYGGFLPGMNFHQLAPSESLEFISTEMENEGKTIKGSPYSAEAITETVQTLSDGNRISHKSTSTLYRDSEGRIRRDQTLAAVGPWVSSNEPLQTTYISDPVAGLSYMLDPKEHTARKIPFMSCDIKTTKTPTSTIVEVNSRTTGNADIGRTEEQKSTQKGSIIQEKVVVSHFDAQEAKQESLGKQTIEGVTTEGTRTTITIAAGKIGNDLPINIVTEKWYSPELQLVVVSKHNDPRMGETIYRLTNINRIEPSRSLFELPPDYKVVEGKHQIYFRQEIK